MSDPENALPRSRRAWAILLAWCAIEGLALYYVIARFPLDVIRFVYQDY